MQSFPKTHRLYGEGVISQLFKTGKRFNVSESNIGINVVFLYEALLEEQTNGFIRVLFSVPKKHIKLAVNRNKAKRRLRESYRKNAHILSEINNKLKTHSQTLHIGFTYRGNSVVSYQEINSLICTALQELEKKISL